MIPRTTSRGAVHCVSSFRRKAVAGYKRPRKQVRFNQRMQVREILHISNYTFEEALSSWYSMQDLYRARVELQKTINQMSCNRTATTTTLENSGGPQCSLDHRGLEHRTKTGKRKRSRTIHGARHAVIEFQRAQKRKGRRSSPEELSTVYAPISSVCAQEARWKGQIDSFSAQLEYSNSVKNADDIVGLSVPSSSSSSCSSCSLQNIIHLPLSPLEQCSTQQRQLWSPVVWPFPQLPLVSSSSLIRGLWMCRHGNGLLRKWALARNYEMDVKCTNSDSFE